MNEGSQSAPQRGTPDTPLQAVREAMATLSSFTKEGKDPAGRGGDGGGLSRYEARDLLLPLGQLILEEDGPEATDLVAEARALVDTLGAAWILAAGEELALAAAEHVAGVEPRWLDHPGYDFGYTERARERLEQRLVAAENLGLELPSALSEGIERADRLLGEARERRADP